MGKKRVASMEPEPEPLCSSDMTHPSKFRRLNSSPVEHREDQVVSAMSGATVLEHGHSELHGNSTNTVENDIEILVVPDSSHASSSSSLAMASNLSREEVLSLHVVMKVATVSASLIDRHHWKVATVSVALCCVHTGCFKFAVSGFRN